VAATDNMNKVQFYHGNATPLEEGDVIEPGHRANWSKDLTKDSKHQYAFATTNLTDAVRYAGRAEYKQQNRNMDRAYEEHFPGVPRGAVTMGMRKKAGLESDDALTGNVSGHIYKVEPVDSSSVSVDPEDENRKRGKDPDAFRSKAGWRVTGKVPYQEARKQAGFKY